MATTRFTSNAAAAISGDDYMDEVAGHVDRMWDASALPLTSIAGSADAVTAVVDPVLDGGLVSGMNFHFLAASTNTGTMTMVIGSEGAVAIQDAAGDALAAGDVISGTLYILHFDGTALRILSDDGADPAGATMTSDTFTADGTLTKPAGFPNDGMVIIEGWGGGGGGSSNSGGGGGAYNRRTFFGSDLGATETVTVGGGGAADTVGGNTSVGTLVLAFGGGKAASAGGGGGGQISAGGPGDGTPTGGAPFGGLVQADGTAAGHGNSGAGGKNAAGGDGIWGGAGGTNNSPGGSSLFGGGGGGNASGGSSVFGGDGGATGVGGTIPAGGGGKSSAVGARGEVRVRWIS